ncbi:MAG: carboxypeptidase regulatory-like domain-containing protein [Planctomycetota bacterium]|nr:MAG: carboxypeptidase regulatory-like domain-containing protein [Planctomycetota bacterium]
MARRLHIVGDVLLLLACAAVLGCGGGPDLPKTVPVKGTVKTKDGKPLANVTVEFVPDGGGQTATGTTDENGNYTLTTPGVGEGAVPGTYKVVLSKTQAAEDTSIYSSGKAPQGDPTQAELPFPKEYTDPSTTPLTKTVTEGENQIDIEI